MLKRRYILKGVGLLFLFGFLLLIFLDVFKPEIFKLLENDKLILLVIVYWIVSILINKFSSRISIVLGIIFLMMCPFLLAWGETTPAQRLAIYAYIILTVGIFQQFFSLLATKKKKKR